MSSFLKSYQSLLQDSLQLLKEEENPWIIGSNEDILFFQNEITFQKKRKTPKPVIEKKVVSLPRQQPKAPKPSPIINKTAPLPKIEIKKPLPPYERPKIETLPLNEIQKMMEKVAPEISHLQKAPDDTRAKQIAQKWKFQTQAAPITILSIKETEKEKVFLEHLTKAIDIHFFPARVVSAAPIEKENGWEAFLSAQGLKLIISSDYAIFELPKLTIHYKEYPAQNKTLLGETPLFMLPSLNLYFKDPLLKHSLWRALKQTISAL